MATEQNSTHTPGPWYFGPMQGWSGVCVMRKPSAEYGTCGTIGDAPIAQVRDGAAHWENSYPVEANARLIAAAPDLLHVAKRLAYAAGMAPGQDRLAAFQIVAEEARAAIAKAGGQS